MTYTRSELPPFLNATTIWSTSLLTSLAFSSTPFLSFASSSFSGRSAHLPCNATSSVFRNLALAEQTAATASSSDFASFGEAPGLDWRVAKAVRRSAREEGSRPTSNSIKSCCKSQSVISNNEKANHRPDRAYVAVCEAVYCLVEEMNIVVERAHDQSLQPRQNCAYGQVQKVRIAIMSEMKSSAYHSP